MLVICSANAAVPTNKAGTAGVDAAALMPHYQYIVYNAPTALRPAISPGTIAMLRFVPLHGEVPWPEGDALCSC